MLSEKVVYFLIQAFSNYPYLIAFLAPLVAFGEFGVFILAFLSAQNIIPLWVVIIFCSLGMITLDSIWFFIVKSKPATKFKKWRRIPKKFYVFERKINKFTKGKDMLIIFVSKLMWGTRALILIYISSKKISFKEYLYYITPPNIAFTIILSIFGWIAGRGFYSLYGSYNNLKLVLLIIVIVIIFFYILFLILMKIIRKKLNV